MDGDTAAIESAHVAEVAKIAAELKAAQEQASVDLDELVAEHRKEAKEHEAEVAR